MIIRVWQELCSLPAAMQNTPHIQKGRKAEMKAELETLCTEYISNRDAVQKAFRWDNNAVYPVCANIFCACGQKAETDRLKACRKVIRKNTGLFSKFRGRKTRSFLASMLALGETAEDRMALANKYYRLLHRKFKGTEYLVLASFLLTDLADQNLTEEKVVRGKELFRRMNKKHRILTNNMDSVFAMMLAFSGKTDDILMEDVEACYRALKPGFSNSGDVQTASQVLSVSDGEPEEKAQRVIDLYNALLEAGVKYGRSRELSPLAALSLTDTPIADLVEEIKAADDFLGTQKGYSSSKEEDLNQRAMHAVMIVSDQYAGTSQVNATVMTNTLEMLIAKKQASRISFIFQVLQALAGLLGNSKEKAEKADKDTAEKKAEGNKPAAK